MEILEEEVGDIIVRRTATGYSADIFLPEKFEKNILEEKRIDSDNR